MSVNVARLIGYAKDAAGIVAKRKDVPQLAASSSIKLVKAVNENVSGVANAVTEFSDTFTKAHTDLAALRAKSGINGMLGLKPSVENAREVLRKELIDTQFANAQGLFRRIKNCFVPAEFPSGAKISLKQSCLNEISDNLAKGKSTKFEYTKKNGDTIRGYVSKMTKKQGEDCYVTQLIRKFGNNASEAVETRYYPKSAQIKQAARKADGQKFHKAVIGSESGGVIKNYR